MEKRLSARNHLQLQDLHKSYSYLSGLPLMPHSVLWPFCVSVFFKKADPQLSSLKGIKDCLHNTFFFYKFRKAIQYLDHNQSKSLHIKICRMDHRNIFQDNKLKNSFFRWGKQVKKQCSIGYLSNSSTAGVKHRPVMGCHIIWKFSINKSGDFFPLLIFS